jgi:hypothetical protein
MRSISLVILFFLTIINFVASDQCTAGDAKAVDTQLSLIGVAYSDALELEINADLDSILIKRDFSCEDGFTCYSIKGYLLCYNPSNHNFVSALGTTGNTATGDYQLADGRKGNLYRGPWPVPTSTGQGAATSGININVYNTGQTSVQTAVYQSQSQGPLNSAGPTSLPPATVSAGPGPTSASGPSAGAASPSLPPLAVKNGALGIQQPANTIWGIGALLAWAILP